MPALLNVSLGMSVTRPAPDRTGGGVGELMATPRERGAAAEPVVARSASKVQNGFVKKRQLVQNPVDLDFECRKAALEYGGRFDSLPFLANLAISRVGCIGLLHVLLLNHVA